MSGGFSIDPTGVRSAAPGFQTVGTNLAAIGERLRAALDAEGECWGNDSYGKTFLTKYAEPHTSAIEYFPKLGKSISEISTGLMEVADTADRGEVASKGGFTA